MSSFIRRDLAIIPLDSDTRMIIACDSCGAIGKKSGDMFNLSPHFAAKFTVRVALTEVLCSGANPVAITNGVSCEMHPTGEETIQGIREEIKNADIENISLIGSTEENFTTTMTALSITAIGLAKESELKFKPASMGDKLILFGTPQVGNEVDLESTGYYPEIRKLLHLNEVKEIVPVGSKGVAYEANTLAALNNLDFNPYEAKIDMQKSAGPATCLLILCANSSVNQVINIHPKSTVIGELYTNYSR